MRGQTVYLDSSAVLKRYVQEPGSDLVRELYRRAYSAEVKLFLSLWNIGEVLGALGKAERIGRIGKEEYVEARRKFLLETRRLVKLNLLEIVPVKAEIVVSAWRVLEKYQIYEADALQVASAKYVGADHFLTSDKKLHEVAREEGLNSTCI
ncbi:type II toxin-antitoxin system VapC family toxin [Infirmifilum sp. NZ]|uniref:type II toxin-antitoxin system VapC family toxin n=1 Tax=Infirmifilum sp. NZ TaxID=2926850 RepID=UPI0027A8693B|nr:type II toxin-antitoxin system VapC family toxin [Infirmifilum sp. NZ]UNQ73619.1 type II toxin-antitoxin system VapC family toxin [Infirmifilum sp. NZ]